MDYKTFAKRINPLICRPEDTNLKKFYGEGMHVILNWTILDTPGPENYDKFVAVLDLLEARGAKLRENYVVVAGKPAEENTGVLFCTQLHVEPGWVCDDDFPEEKITHE